MAGLDGTIIFKHEGTEDALGGAHQRSFHRDRLPAGRATGLPERAVYIY
jgi:hypothetical protein